MGLRGLPEFLVANPGLNSGFMIPQYAAASMVSQNKMYCYAASSYSIAVSYTHLIVGAIFERNTKTVEVLLRSR